MTREERLKFQKGLLAKNEELAIKKMKDYIKIKFPHIVLEPVKVQVIVHKFDAEVGQKRPRDDSVNEIIDEGGSLPVISGDSLKR